MASSIQEQLVDLGLVPPSEDNKSLAKHEKRCAVCKMPVHKAYFDKHLKEQHGIFQKVKKNKCIDCPECGVKVLPKNLQKHIRKAHKKNNKRNAKSDVRSKSQICDICGQEIAGNINHHKKQVHPARQPKLGAPAKPKRKQKKLSPKQASARLKEIRDQKFFHDQAILDYLSRVPEIPKYGKFGVPQDKYRWGFYGHRSMEYDIWGRN